MTDEVGRACTSGTAFNAFSPLSLVVRQFVSQRAASTSLVRHSTCEQANETVTVTQR
jgi:hypothetical protein